MAAKDLFSLQASDYAKYRPTYPSELFTYLTKLCSHRDVAWDCATGSGQSAYELAKFFNLVMATDLSQKQLQQARRHPQIRYSQGRAEQSGLPYGTADLITVAQAFHWFDHTLFFREARRVVKPQGGILAIWSYQQSSINQSLDPVLAEFHNEVVGKYGEVELKTFKENFAKVPIPFQEIRPPAFCMKQSWNLDQLKGYLFTWSATQTMIKKTGKNPVDNFCQRLDLAWGDPNESKDIFWPVLLRVGRL